MTVQNGRCALLLSILRNYKFIETRLYHNEK
jgi:hypothetical protein